MKTRWLLVAPLLLVCWTGCSSRPEPAARDTATAPDRDNTAVNARDRDGSTLTPGDQAENEADLGVTQRIRQAIVEDDSLSTNAHNVKIITVDGVVTLRGPVQSEQEKRLIQDKAQQVAGVARVENELEVITR
jgi:osmotically-inducible protein OsmY